MERERFEAQKISEILYLISTLVMTRPKADLFVQIFSFSWRVDALSALCVPDLKVE